MSGEMLKPCPFCGGEPEIRERKVHHTDWFGKDYRLMYRVRCTKCGAAIGGYSPVLFHRDSNGIEHGAGVDWNTRTPEQAIAATLGEKPRDRTEEWLLKAVEAGDTASFTRVMLGDLYTGAVAPGKTDYEKAIEWFTKSMEVDNPEPYGMYQLGNIYYQGYGGETDYEKAFELFNRAVEIWKAQNSTDVIFAYTVEQIGDMYSYGRGVEKDKEKAAEYYKWADELNSR